MILVPEPKEYLARLKGTIDAYMGQLGGYNNYLELVYFLDLNYGEEKVFNDHFLLPNEVNLAVFNDAELTLLESILGKYGAMELKAEAVNLFNPNNIEQQEKRNLDRSTYSGRKPAEVIYLDNHLNQN